MDLISMKEQKPTQSGFTLIEMLVVIAIIVLLASLIFPAISGAIKKAQQTKCMSNLRNFGIAWNTNYLSVKSGRYQYETDAIFPWLSSMVPDYASPANLICPGDKSHGKDGSKPNGQEYLDRSGDKIEYSYSETNDFDNNPEVKACSYMYEFNAAECSWWGGWSSEFAIFGSNNQDWATDEQANLNSDVDNIVSWAEAKLVQLAYGDTYSEGGYDPSRFPLVRCFHHYEDKKVRINNLYYNRIESSVRVQNVAMDGHVFLSGMQWEYPVAP